MSKNPDRILQGKLEKQSIDEGLDGEGAENEEPRKED